MKTEVSTLRIGITREVFKFGDTKIIISYQISYFQHKPIILN